MILGLRFLLAILSFFVWLVWSSPLKRRRFGDASGGGPYHGTDTANGSHGDGDGWGGNGGDAGAGGDGGGGGDGGA